MDEPYTAAHVAEALQRVSASAAKHGISIAETPGVTNTPEEIQQRWQVIVAAAGDGSGVLCDTSVAHLRVIYNYIEMVISNCGAPDSFDVYEACFETLSKIGFFLQSGQSKELLLHTLENVNEVYDVLLSCVETYEWMQPGATGLLRLWMLQVIFSCFGFDLITGRHLMALTDNDVSGAISLVSFMLSCQQAPYQMQETAGRCLVELTTADSVFLSNVHQSDLDGQTQAITKLTQMLNKHVNGLIKGIIQFDIVEAFGRCICQHQMSHTRTDVIIKYFLTTIHNCLLYCSENQKKLRQHLATQSVVHDVMIPYVYNILPALWDQPAAGPTDIEWQNLKSTLQTFVVVTFNINVFRPHLRDSDMIPQIFKVPNILTHISMLELLVKIAINVDYTKGGSSDVITCTLNAAFASLPEESQKRLQRRMTSERSMRLPYSRSSQAVETLAVYCTSPPGEEAKEAQAHVAQHNKARKKQWRSARNRRRKRKRLFNQKNAKQEVDPDPPLAPEEPDDSSDDDDLPPLMSAEGWEAHLGPQDEVTSIPSRALCELSGAMMCDPVQTPDGHLFERAALEDWMTVSASNPTTGTPLSLAQCAPAQQIQELIQGYQLQMISACEIAPEAFEQPPALQDEALNASLPSGGNRLLGDLPSLVSKPPSPTNKRGKGKIRIASRSVVDCPEEMRCAIDGKVCINPVRAPSGYLFEKKTLEKWIQNCGSVCPVTSNPLRLEDCQLDTEMKKNIVKFLKNQDA